MRPLNNNNHNLKQTPHEPAKIESCDNMYNVLSIFKVMLLTLKARALLGWARTLPSSPGDGIFV